MQVNQNFCLSKIGAGLMLALVFMIGADFPGIAADDIKLVIDGKTIKSSPPPVIKNDRTLVPVRLVSESLGAKVEWREAEKNVVIIRGNRSVLLRIDNRLVDYYEGSASFGLSDVPPQIIQDRTFVPLRLVSNALGVAIKWDGTSRTVYVDSVLPPEAGQPFAVGIASVQPGQAITGAMQLQAVFSGAVPAGAAEIRFFLLDPETGKGAVIARGNDLAAAYRWLPEASQCGRQVLAVSLYDQEGRFLAGSAIPVEMAVAPQVSLAGIANGQEITDAAALRVNLNFLAEYVKYEITNLKTGKATVTAEADPEGAYQWTPQFTDNGNYTIRTIASDGLGQAYASQPVAVSVNVARKQELRGVAAGTVVEKPVTLWVWRNYPVSMTEYVLKNTRTGKVETLVPADGYSGCSWFPGPEQAGTWELSARVKDTAGNVHVTGTVTVEVKDTPRLLLQTVGPNQVLTGAVKLKSVANAALNSIEYVLVNPKTGAKKVIARGSDPAAEYSWTPGKNDAGNWNIQAVGTMASGGKVSSEAVPVRVYLGKIYEAKPLMEKSKFLDFVSGLAVKSREKTGMSAALQVAQAILETGWGQSTPVDKYTGKLSYNLFGIKGQGPAGSVISNTWEEYNGNTYRVDAEFRAYYKPEDSWDDHKKLLLNSSRYGPFRAVMNDSTLGAWALKRCGYATDSRYPLKLIDIIKRYNLNKLDEVVI
ncbi:MAG: stalk domain-containing protein [Peptococcaceae bacterium]|jgi:hypothetical protein|nr:stalk domain-containing protein [Peptococcaceae bacterium]MDH7526403.1 stalk domain-containing protein [Peptococcaceae bacterium]